MTHEHHPHDSSMNAAPAPTGTGGRTGAATPAPAGGPAQGLSLSAALLLTTAPLMWSGNAVVGQLGRDWISPFALNAVRWALALVLLLPLVRAVPGFWAHLRDLPKSGLWKYYALVGLLGIGCYNGLLYLALKTSSPLNVTLVGSSMPVWMLALGRVFWGQTISWRQAAGAVLSIIGVTVVLVRGDWHALWHMHWVAGDILMVLATIIWAVYTWLLTRYPGPAHIQANWAAFLFCQVLFGAVWAALIAGAEAALGQMVLVPGWPLVAMLLFISIGPAIVAYRCWGAGVRRAGPAVAGFFANLIPLFTAILSAAILGQSPHAYHALAFVLIVGGIWVSSRK